MKIVLSVFCVWLICLNASAQDVMDKIEFFGENPGNLKMELFAPNVDQLKRPLVVALHGCSQNSDNLANITEWNRLAREHNFIVLYPNQKRVNNSSNCFNWFELEDISRGSGELQSIISMVDYTIDKYNIDTTRVFVYGVSAGAAMGVALLAVYPTYFNSGAILAGAPYKAATTKNMAFKAMFSTVNKSPKEWGELIPKDSVVSYPNLVVFHGVKDKIVDIDNSLELIEQWSSIHNMDTTPDLISNDLLADGVSRIVYTNNENEEKIVFYKFLHGGHVIPIDPGSGITQGGKLGAFSKDLNFFSTYHIAKEFELISSKP